MQLTSSRGFTIVELLIVIAIIAILTAIGVASYDGIRRRAHSVTQQHDISFAKEIVEKYYAEYGEYPRTTNNDQQNWKAIDVFSDANCGNGSHQEDWIPGVDQKLPQSIKIDGYGVDHKTGCYLYASNGKSYLISAWNMTKDPQTSVMYRRVGFREFQTDTSTQFYTCNSNTVGGATGNAYDINQDYYKHSYTISNISNCDETPPPGA